MAQSNGAALAGALGGEAQHSNLRIDAEQLCGLSGLNSNLSKLCRSGDLDLAGSLINGIGIVDVNSAVAHGNALQALFTAVTVQNEAGADQMCALLGLDQLQSGTNGVGSGVSSAAQQAISLAHLHQHGAEVVGLLQQSGALLSGLLTLAQFHHGVDHLIETGIVLGIDDFGSGNIKVTGGSSSLALSLVAHHDDLQHALGQQLCSGLQNAGIIALGENDRLGICLQLCYQRCKHISHCDYLRIYFPIFTSRYLLDTRMPFSFILAHTAKSSRQNWLFVLQFLPHASSLFSCQSSKTRPAYSSTISRKPPSTNFNFKLCTFHSRFFFF